ncbi:hypothetical protein F444_12501 [Phytophthora nicotianae P1976]|uniref:Uncharacterized protein n=1 Tax=Phytophthora nicotianae P1976 TaxID=1317066 RepID=A0A080ZWQ3_PHYNI|nr:hypothetical protein F444_12501 [Phytophthora nicotianae P1976]
MTYKCAEHDNCGRIFRIRAVRTTELKTLPFVLEAKGLHSGEPTGRKKTGIHPAFAFEVDTAVMGKEGP